MRTKSKACRNTKCAGLSDILDDPYVGSSGDHALLFTSPSLDRNTPVSRTDLPNSVLDASTATTSAFCHINDCIQGSENQKSDITIPASNGMSSVMLSSDLLQADSRFHDSRMSSSTVVGPMTQMGTARFSSPVIQYSVLSSSSPAIASVSHPPLFQSMDLRLSSATLDFNAGVARQLQSADPCVGLQLLGNDASNMPYVRHPPANARSSAGIVIRDTTIPLKFVSTQPCSSDVSHFKDKGKGKVDCVSSSKVRSTRKRLLREVEPSRFNVTDDGVMCYDPVAASIDEDTLDYVLDTVACGPSLSFSPTLPQMGRRSATISHHANASSDPQVNVPNAPTVSTSASSHRQTQRKRCNRGSRGRAPASVDAEVRASPSAAHATCSSTVPDPMYALFDTSQSDHPTNTNVHIRGPPTEYRSFGSCTYKCTSCQALFWLEERIVSQSTKARPVYHRCCLGGRVKLYMHSQYPAYIKTLFSDRAFMDNIRAYNQMFAMTSLGATIDDSINNARGPYVFKVSGQIYHWIGGLCPPQDEVPRFLQLYIYDTQNEVQNRLSHFTGEARRQLDPQIVDGLIHFLDEHNALIQLFRTAREKMMAHDIPEFKVRVFGVIGRNQYELPTSDSIGAIVYDGGPETVAEFDVVIEKRPGDPQRINKLHPCYMAFQFPLLFVYGEQGYHVNLKLNNINDQITDPEKNMSMNAYYAYQIHDRHGRYNLLTRSGRLFQQYVVTAYCSIEQSRTDFLRHHQDDIRGEYLSGLYDAITRGDRDGSDVGSRIILPASFTGGPRYMYSHYLDALAICRVHGNPSFFVTFTCNVRWPEIVEYMEAFPHINVGDRPDIIDRVFERKIHSLIKYVRDRQPFGEISAVLYTVEFQKRGLPHCHLLFWIKERYKIARDSDVDRYICAELPDRVTDPEAYRVVCEFMLHGPCGSAFPNAPCAKSNGGCKKRFPKDYCPATYVDKNGYVHYRRRDSGATATRHGVQLDNSNVVPYNLQLCLVFYAHINVEYCGWTMLIKYLFKYISKGTDRIVARVVRPIGQPRAASTSGTQQPAALESQNICVDEIKNFIDARFIGPHEACWRIFNFDIHHRQPAVQILAVHLENMQRLTFRAGQRLQSIINNPRYKKTTLTEWLEFNKHFTFGRHLTYLNFPSEFVWQKADREWTPRVNKRLPCIGRLTYIHPGLGDLYYQRMLLCHQKGCQSFAGIRTVNGHVHPTNRSACEALGLLGDDREWVTALEEAAISASSAELRTLFIQLLIFCDVVEPESLWNSFWEQMSHDIPLRLSQILSIPLRHMNEPELRGGVLYELEAALAFYGKSLMDFGLPMPPQGLLDMLQNRLVMEEKCYDRTLLASERDVLLPQLNAEQRDI